MPTATNLPAILGGEQAVTLDQKIANAWPIITEQDEQAVLDVLRSGNLSLHPIVGELEEDYKKLTGRQFALTHNNGTSAILAGLHAIGIQPFDEVIVPSATWWSSVMPVLHCGGVPVFAELESDCLGLDPEDVESKITDKTKAIVIVHLFGVPSKIDELVAIANKHNLKILEDASHAHGATYKGNPIGSFGDVSIFSMQGNKLCPSGEGGILLCDDQDTFESAIRLGHYERLLNLESQNKYFAATGFGFKFRMAPMAAALAHSQLKKMPERNALRNKNCAYLSRKLETLGIETFLSTNDTNRVYFEFLVRYNENTSGLPITDLAKALQAEGALVSAPRYPLLHQQPVFTQNVWSKIARLPATKENPIHVYDPADLPKTILGNGTLLKLPSFPSADEALLDQYFLAFEKVLEHTNDLPRTDC
ncbi:MAG TPA: DegT/DnrJ/EryC1/StrS family aminotransferase [Phycisphaerales bacterium]|nr:DegT/DnrJ/EryC1/StrS family aminotransferase [Phycisphaerales bacterium]HIB50951.1 DegT/DnrJ/EryC1/StrS family aminotransferase [Phycisphaerales bacterium]HIO53075.1 DegT/DnrJ/EryC1/StrS family aminotransferase [Phycisphaerales bacterium]